MYRCPNTGYRVQGEAVTDTDIYEAVLCALC